MIALPPTAAAAVLAGYWRQAEAGTAAKRELATFLMGYLSGKDTAMPDALTPLAIRYAVKSDAGLKREQNEDAAYAGPRLLAVADGLGGHAAGEVASAAAIEALKSPDTDVPAGELLNVLERAVHQANATLRDMVDAEPSLRGMGMTLTGILWPGSQLSLVHIGDSRAYLLRDGELVQITHDHSLVQSLLDSGRITPAEATSHPRRSVILRALGSGNAEPDLQLRDARHGDRYLLCSDGLHDVVPVDGIARVLSDVAEPGEGVAALIELANQAGGPDNITCIIADVMPLKDPAVPPADARSHRIPAPVRSGHDCSRRGPPTAGTSHHRCSRLFAPREAPRRSPRPTTHSRAQAPGFAALRQQCATAFRRGPRGVASSPCLPRREPASAPGHRASLGQALLSGCRT